MVLRPDCDRVAPERQDKQVTLSELASHVARLSGLTEIQAASAIQGVIAVEAEAVQLRRGDDFEGYARVSSVLVITQEAMERAIYLDAKAAGDVE